MEAEERLVRPAVRKMKGYTPGKQPAPGETYLKLNTNENPYPPSPRVAEAIKEELGRLHLYPDPRGARLRNTAARLYNLNPDQILCGNGSDEILALIMRAFVDPGETVAFFDPSYSLYPVLCEIAEAQALRVELPARPELPPPPRVKAKMFILTSPNAPYGLAFPNRWVEEFLQSFSGLVVADEAYIDFAAESAVTLLARYPQLLVTRTFSKSYALAGMRLGLCFAREELIRELLKVKDSYNLDRLTLAAGEAALSDQEYFREQITRIKETREWFSAALVSLGFSVLPSATNYIFAVPPTGQDPAKLYQWLEEKHVLIRYFPNSRAAHGLRISIGARNDMELLAGLLKEYLELQF